ncbi:hypothetical protein C8J41_1035 [Sphingomonas sp. PP-CC-3G-468]|nr:hypothetical protein C8J39_0121 [Sphingomonas sp. PP-CC-1A-547]TCM07105.1 hypothetical protein C8J41_1035 [Sphingomonas sp. PP-CC-3G-468]
MMICRWVVAFAALALTACGSDLPDYRYKMTVHVATPGGDRAYSSVRGIHSEYVSSIMSSSGRTIKDTLQGEAVIMDLPDGRTVYALLSRPDNLDYATYVTGPALGRHIPRAKSGDITLASAKGAFLDEIVSRREAMLALKGPYDLPRTVTHNPSHRTDYQPEQMWPMFVMFSDPANPKTVIELSPEAIGVSNISIALTEDEISSSVLSKLPWLPNQHGALVPTPVGGSMFDKKPAQRVTAGAFRIGFP